MNTSLITMLSAELPGRIIGFDAQLLWDLGMQLFNTFLIVILLYYILHKPVTEMLEKRKQGIAKNIDDAKAAKADAIELKANYEEKITKIDEEAAAILKEVIYCIGGTFMTLLKLWMNQLTLIRCSSAYCSIVMGLV